MGTVIRTMALTLTQRRGVGQAPRPFTSPPAPCLPSRSNPIFQFVLHSPSSPSSHLFCPLAHCRVPSVWFVRFQLSWRLSVWGYWCFTSQATILQSYMWRHRCAGGLVKELYLRSGSQRHTHFVGFFNVSVLHRHGTPLFTRWFRRTAPFSCLLRHAGDTEDIVST